MKTSLTNLFSITLLLLAVAGLINCSGSDEPRTAEQVAVNNTAAAQPETDSLQNSVAGNLSMKQLLTYPDRVILTGMPAHRLLGIYKPVVPQGGKLQDRLESFSSKSYDYHSDTELHFMPGIDILYGYNLLNIVHYDFGSGKNNFLFSSPVLVKTLYYPSFVQDSVDGKPIQRDYFLVSVYDEDTNHDSILNRSDLRHIYHFDAGCISKTALLPPGYSVSRSQYDAANDAMYLFARHDANGNGTEDESEPLQVFWISLKTPGKARLLY